jgi:hypothetical protein
MLACAAARTCSALPNPRAQGAARFATGNPLRNTPPPRVRPHRRRRVGVLIRVQAIRPGRVARKRIPPQQRATPRIIPPRAEIHKVVVVQLAREAERLGGGAALGGAEGGVGEGGGNQRGARVE